MANPYPVAIQDERGIVHSAGFANFTDAENQPGGGGSQTIKVVRFPFVYSAAGLNDGVTIYTPATGELLLDAGINVYTAWDGTTPVGDVGIFAPSGPFALGGWFAMAGLITGMVNGLDMTKAWSVQGGMLAGDGNFNRLSMAVSDVGDGSQYAAVMRFPDTDPVKVVVSQDGAKGGLAPGASQGSAEAWLLIATV